MRKSGVQCDRAEWKTNLSAGGGPTRRQGVCIPWSFSCLSCSLVASILIDCSRSADPWKLVDKHELNKLIPHTNSWAITKRVRLKMTVKETVGERGVNANIRKTITKFRLESDCLGEPVVYLGSTLSQFEMTTRRLLHIRELGHVKGRDVMRGDTHKRSNVASAFTWVFPNYIHTNKT